MTADPRVLEMRDKVFAGERLSFEEGVYLDKNADLMTLGEMANHIREKKNGNITYYNVNQHLNPTNVCVYRCNFCAFRADLKSPRGYVMSDEQILERARNATEAGATELHIVGGLHHLKSFEWYKNILQIIHKDYPDLHLKAWTAVEWDWFQRLTKRPIKELLQERRWPG
jgi:aminodeoxyfutalosine synthase